MSERKDVTKSHAGYRPECDRPDTSPGAKAEAHATVRERGQWSSEWGFMFSMAAASISLGNLWRFPYMAGENGGAAFIIAYVIALFGVAVPLMMLEVAAGRLAHGGTVRTFRGVTRAGRFYGWFVVALTAVITSYYLVITGWTLGFVTRTATLTITDFEAFTEGYNSVWFFLAVTAITALVNWRGLGAIVSLSRYMMPLLLATVIGLVFYAMQLEGWTEATGFLFSWEPGQLTNPRTWYFAFGQAFFTVAIGQGYLVTYGSYIPRETHVPRASLVVTSVQGTVAILAGLMIFPMVFTHDIDPATGSQLAFKAMPEAFREMTGGVWLALIFFALFFVAALSSCLAGMKVVVAAIAERLAWTTGRAVLLLSGVFVVLGLPSALSYAPTDWSIGGRPVLDFVDQVAGTNTVLISGVVGAGLLCWTISKHRIGEGLGSHRGWWVWRVVLVGRSAPILVAALLTWRLASSGAGG